MSERKTPRVSIELRLTPELAASLKERRERLVQAQTIRRQDGVSGMIGEMLSLALDRDKEMERLQAESVAAKIQIQALMAALKAKDREMDRRVKAGIAKATAKLAKTAIAPIEVPLPRCGCGAVLSVKDETDGHRVCLGCREAAKSKTDTDGRVYPVSVPPLV